MKRANFFWQLTLASAADRQNAAGRKEGKKEVRLGVPPLGAPRQGSHKYAPQFVSQRSPIESRSESEQEDAARARSADPFPRSSSRFRLLRRCRRRLPSGNVCCLRGA